MKDQEPRFCEECIVDSLLLLMRKKRYDRITMDEISAKAGVSRRTVYRHFHNKLDILKTYIDRLIAEYWARIAEPLKRGETIVEHSFAFIDDHFDFFRIAHDNRLLINILDILHTVIARVVRSSRADGAPAEDDAYFDSYVAYVAGGCWGLLQTWLEAPVRRTPREMVDDYRRIARDLYTRLHHTRLPR